MKNMKLKENDSLLSFKPDEHSPDHYLVQGDLEVGGIIDCENPIHCCRFHPNGETFSVGLSDGSIKLFKKQNCQLLYTLIDDDIRQKRLPVTSIRFFNRPNDLNQDHYKILVATYVSGFIKYWHYPTKSCIFTIFDKELMPLSIGFNSSFTRMTAGGYDCKIKVYDVDTKKQINCLESGDNGTTISGHSSRVYCVKYHPVENNQIFSGGWDDTVQIWDDRISHSQNYIYGPHICGDAIDIDSNYNHLLTGSWRKNSTLQIWDLRNFSLIRDVFQNKSSMMIYGCQWLSTSYIYVGGNDKNSAQIYDRGTLKSIGGLSELLHGVACIDNDHSDDLPNLIACSLKKLFLLKRKKISIFKSSQRP
ncbi:WD repeat-containing 5-like [Brachionus plicatilis]|uniref:WD repeat-containing 5-like n=1 Tax=Brachionus plicatilis TaxID=10195 RepID=A0A3M7SRU1_BRAPC|nr:WD repeat-containing 5-like [Brachionus plicatilis]